jgi:hypothetical protein
MKNAMKNDASNFAASTNENAQNTAAYVEFLQRYTKHMEETLIKNKAFNQEMRRVCDILNLNIITDADAKELQDISDRNKALNQRMKEQYNATTDAETDN